MRKRTENDTAKLHAYWKRSVELHERQIALMCQRKENAITREHIFRTMREMLLEAPPEEVTELAQEAGLDAAQLAKAGRAVAHKALEQHRIEATIAVNVYKARGLTLP